MTDRAVCVIGAGLIGGSLLRAAEKAGRTVWGSCASAETARQAAADGFDVDTDIDAALRRAAAADALVVLAVPLPALPAVLRRVDRVAPGCRLTDAVSVKVATAEAVRRYAPRARYVGGHPMAGTAESGWAAGQAGLFADAAWVVSRRRRAGRRGVGRRRRAGLGLRRAGGAGRGRRARPGGGQGLAPAAPDGGRAGRRSGGGGTGAIDAGRAGAQPGRVLVRRRDPGRRHPPGAGAGHVRGQPGRRCWPRWTTRWAGWA